MGELGRVWESLGQPSEPSQVSWDGTGRHWEEIIHCCKASGGGSRRSRGIRCSRGEEVFTGCMVARQSSLDGTGCALTYNGSARGATPRAVAPRTGVYIIIAWYIRRTGRTRCTRA